MEHSGQRKLVASGLRAAPVLPMYWNSSSTALGVRRMLSALSNQNRLHGAQAVISIGRSMPKASSMSEAIGSLQFGHAVGITSW